MVALNLQDRDLVLQIRNLGVCFDLYEGRLTAVDDVSIDIPRAKVTVMCGESGSGKSTICYSILRLVPKPGKILTGQILYNEADLLQMGDPEIRTIRGRNISMVFQDPRSFLNPIMKVGAQIAEVILRHQSLKRATAKAKVLNLLREVNIHHAETIYDFFPHELSGGMLQRVVIAMAIACGPSLLLCDEPTTALDVTTQRQILALLQDLKRKFQMSLILVTHDLAVAAMIADFVHIMYAGKIVESGSVSDIYARATHPYTQGLFNSVFSVEEMKTDFKEIEGSPPNMMDLPSGCAFHPRCPKVMDRCRTEYPPSFELEDRHFVSCWLCQ
jgi:peptide/nickel transport system ATP-binding protein